jgi:hypothetical protein
VSQSTQTSATLRTEENTKATIRFAGDTWRVLSKGITNEAGDTYCHLASTTRFQQQRNGSRPIQAGIWIPAVVLQ